MIENLLEIGEIGLLRDIPSELTVLTNENGLLKHANAKLKSERRFFICVLVGVAIYFIWQDIKKQKKQD